MIKFCHHAVQNIFPVRLLDGFVKLSQMYGCSSFLICYYNKHHYWSNLVEKRISSILQITLHYQGKSSHDLKIESNRDTVLTDFSQAHLQRPCLYSPGPLAQRWYCSQCAMLYYINYQSAITPQKCCKLHTSQQLQQLLRTQRGWVQNRLKFMDARGNSQFAVALEKALDPGWGPDLTLGESHDHMERSTTHWERFNKEMLGGIRQYLTLRGRVPVLNINSTEGKDSSTLIGYTPQIENYKYHHWKKRGNYNFLK